MAQSVEALVQRSEELTQTCVLQGGRRDMTPKSCPLTISCVCKIKKNFFFFFKERILQANNSGLRYRSSVVGTPVLERALSPAVCTAPAREVPWEGGQRSRRPSHLGLPHYEEQIKRLSCKPEYYSLMRCNINYLLCHMCTKMSHCTL